MAKALPRMYSRLCSVDVYCNVDDDGAASIKRVSPISWMRVAGLM